MADENSIQDNGNYIKINWSGTDQDTDKLWYNIYALGNLESANIPIVIMSGKEEVTVLKNQLIAGDSPQIKIVASDGWNTTEKIISLPFPLDLPDTILVDTSINNEKTVLYPPRIIYHSPGKNELSGSNTSTIKILFTGDVDTSTINLKNIIVKANGVRLDGGLSTNYNQPHNISWSGTKETFPAKTNIEVTLQGIKGKNGTEIEEIIWQFQVPEITRKAWR